MLPDPQQTFVDAYNKIEPSTPWLQDLRREAMAKFCEQGLPNKKVEAWKYTNLLNLNKQNYTLNTDATFTAAQLAELNLPTGDKLICVNGKFDAELSSCSQDKITFSSLSTAIQNQPGLIKPYLERAPSPNVRGFADINTALFQDGVVVHIRANHKAEPILLLCVYTSDVKHHMQHMRNIIICDANSEASLVEYHLGLTEVESLTSCVNEVYLKENSQCQVLRIQAAACTASHFTETRVEQARDSQFVHENFDIKGKQIRHDLQANLNEPGATVRLNGLYYATDKQYVDSHTTINHVAPHTHSQEFYKGVIADQAHAVFNGRVIVHKNASKITTDQKNPNLLLSAKAEINTKPELEIYNDDVKAAHGATVAQLDEKALFYLMSRGIDADTAKSALLTGFVQEMIDTIPSPEWKAYLQSKIELRFQND